MVIEPAIWVCVKGGQLLQLQVTQFVLLETPFYDALRIGKWKIMGIYERRCFMFCSTTEIIQATPVTVLYHGKD